MKIDKSLSILVDHKLGKTFNRVYRVGVEIEGGWVTPPKGAEIIRDGSVMFKSREIGNTGSMPHVGEICSPLLEVSAMGDWVTKHHPDIVNETCGMHLHMSFKHAFLYARLMVPEYPATILSYMERWACEEKLPTTHPLWERLFGMKEHCQHIYWADQQVKVTSKDYDKHRAGHRYTLVNYPYGRYKTIECRLLCMMNTPKQSMKALQRVVDVTNAFLAVTGKKEERKWRADLVDDGDAYEEQRVEFV